MKKRGKIFKDIQVVESNYIPRGRAYMTTSREMCNLCRIDRGLCDKRHDVLMVITPSPLTKSS